MLGLDAWFLTTGESSVVLPAGVGKSKPEVDPDRAAYRMVLKRIVSSPAQA